MHPKTQEVMDRLNFSRFDIIDHPVREKIIDNIKTIVSHKLERYDLTESSPRRVRKKNVSMDPVDRATRVVQSMILWNITDAAIRNHNLKLPEPKFRSVLDLIKDTADYYVAN